MDSLSVRAEIEELIKSLKLDRSGLHEVRKDQWRHILSEIEERFLVKTHHTQGLHWGWNRLQEPQYSASFVDKDYAKLRDIIQDESIWFIAEDRYDKLWIYEGKTVAILQVIPELCHLNEYYLISKKLQWLLCEDHHDMLHLSGQPVIDRCMRYESSNP
ncbi:DUF6756 family protein [Paenibacillus sp. FSL H7-0350]|uniref:DUF6756 family protein n=1 Tax=Paenibacillus sp. FSL H7-0350 TaxID=2975345 RepID=UPI0031594E2B